MSDVRGMTRKHWWREGRKAQPIKLRLIRHAKYNKETGCLEWFYGTDSKGYGTYTIRRFGKIVLKRAHRKCISTAKKHVYLGDKSQNTLDSIEAGTFNYPGSR